MTYLEGSTIKITRGDTLKIKINVYKDGKPYTCKTGDTLRFAMKSAYTDEECLITATIPTDTLILYVSATDMKKLAVNKKGYVYDIQLTDADGVVDTIISDRLITMDEVD